MRKFYILLLTLFIGLISHTQLITNYTFNAAGGTYTPLVGGTAVPSLLADDVNSTSAIPLGFTFYYMGVPYNSVTANSNGWISFNATPSTNAANMRGNNLATANAGLHPLIAPLWDDLMGTVASISGGTPQASYLTTGAPGNRVFTFEWLNWAPFSATTIAATISFQAVLYEATGKIEFYYRQEGGSTAFASASIGISNSSTSFASLDGTSASPTVSNVASANTITTRPATGQVYSFTPPAITPNAASALNFTSVGSGAMTLNWTDNSSDEAGFTILRSLDGVNYTFAASVGADVVTYSATGLAVNTLYYWQVIAVTEGRASAPASGSQSTTPPGNMIATSSGNWSSPGTWSGGLVPSAGDNVTIADGVTVTIDNTSAVCYNLVVGQGVSGALQFLTSGAVANTLTVSNDVTVASGGTFNISGTNTGTKILNIGGSSNASANNGNLTVEGTFNMDGGTNMQATVNFYGTGSSTISGTGATCNFFAIVVNKGISMSPVLDVQRLITINAPAASASRLTITNGTFKLSSASTLTPYFGSQTICASTGRLWLNNASGIIRVVGLATTTGSGSPTVSGELKIDAGTFGYGSGNNAMTFTSGSGVLNMSGGTINMYGAVSFPSSAGTQLLMSGGNFNVSPQAGNNLATGTALFSIGASTTVNWSGGTITIIDPHNAAGGTAFTAASGGTKTITGGTLRLGNGTSVLTGGTLANNSGFGILSTMPIWNLEIDNRTDVSTSRMARISGSTVIANNLVVNANSYLFLGSGTTGNSIFMTKAGAPITNNGTIAGTEPGGTQFIGGLVFGNGGVADGAQSFTGTGFVNIGSVGISNSNGVTYTGAAANVQRVNLFTATFDPGTLIIGHPTAAPAVQVAGGTGVAGSFTTLPAYNTTAGNLTLIYSTSSNITNHQMGAANEVSAGDQTLASLNISSAAITVAANRNLTLTGTLTLTGDLIMNTNNLTMGISGTVLGSISGAGGIRTTTGYIKRWFGTSALPTSATLGSGGFPFRSGTTSRLANVYFSGATAASAAGSITITHTDASGLADITPSFTDNGAQMEKRTNSKWAITTGDGLTLSGTASLELTGTNSGGFNAITDLRLIQPSAAAGTFVATAGTPFAPIVKRTALSLSDLANDMHIGTPLANVLKSAIQSGNWGDVTTWEGGIVPIATDGVNIPAGITVTLAGAGGVGSYNAVCNSVLLSGTLVSADNTNTLSISGNLAAGFVNNGVFNLSNGTITLGSVGNNNRTFTNSIGSTLNVSGGTFDIFGNMSVVSGSVFSQSGGGINVDGNSGLPANSVASGVSIVAFNPAAATDLNLTGGTFTIVDPHANTTASNAFALSGTFTGSPNVTTGHTFRFGNGISTDAGGNAVGFQLNTWVSTSGFKFGNLIIEGAAGTNRQVQASSTTFGPLVVLGNLTINNGGEYRQTGTAAINAAITVGGNITVNTGGTLTAIGVVNLGDANFTGSTTMTLGTTNTPQTIGGAGTFRNLTAAPTAQLTNLLVNNINSAGATLSNDLSLSGILTFTKGNINTGANKLILIAGASTSGAAQTTGWVNGNLQRNFATGSSVSRTFDVGTNNFAPFTINMASVTTAGNAIVSSTSNDHPDIGNSGLAPTKSVNRYWTVANSGIVFTTATVTCNWQASDLDAGVNTANLKVGKYDSPTWSLPTVASPTATSIQATDISSFSDFIVAIPNNLLPAQLLTFSGQRQGSVNQLRWTVAQEIDVQTYDVERSYNGRNWERIGSVASLGNTSSQRSYVLSDNNFTGLKQQYRLRIVDNNRVEKLSNIVVITGSKAAVLTVSGLFPNPALTKVNLLVDAPAKDNVTIMLMDAVGRVVKTQRIAVEAGSNTLQMDVTGLGKGSYLVTLTGESNKETTISKFVKE